MLLYKNNESELVSQTKIEKIQKSKQKDMNS